MNIPVESIPNITSRPSGSIRGSFESGFRSGGDFAGPKQGSDGMQRYFQSSVSYTVIIRYKKILLQGR